MFLLAASRLGVPATTCLVVEDAVPGIEAALAAGMRVVRVVRVVRVERVVRVPREG